jgi:hypothetical protein
LAIALALNPDVPPPAMSHGNISLSRSSDTGQNAPFPTDLEGTKLIRTGMLHYGFAVASFAFTYTTISGTTPAAGSPHSVNIGGRYSIGTELDRTCLAHPPFGYANLTALPSLQVAGRALPVVSFQRTNLTGRTGWAMWRRSAARPKLPPPHELRHG